MRFVNLWCTLLSRRCEKRRTIIFSRYWRKITCACKFHSFERLKSVRNDLRLSLHSLMVSLKKKSESLMKYCIKVTCAYKWARKLPRKTETYASAKCVPCNTRKCTHNGFVTDLLKWALKCRFYATWPWFLNPHRGIQNPRLFWIILLRAIFQSRYPRVQADQFNTR